ncbi:flagellar brake protein [Alkaliphilus hydrothermalis]|uniref:C-di-GMP-binding flagellar brake protein YcgR n=1 Tax=Alkaliphilus hydrothermalis TaxID=1482730 RepID=A0ABS2NN10_9FIRM|nr:PilZ domain-containing protein [Alkaliphilus hydrothermalis]MBM7614241.1 c-di-GMP-binding flagellar brake protein YcgR [Alkaliphilus hydrothermalis]
MKGYLEQGMPIKLEIDVSPPHFYLWGEIGEFQGDEMIVKIEGQYAQREVRRVKCTIPRDTKACTFETFIMKGKEQAVVLKMPPLNGFQLIQRRKYLRVDVDIPVNCYLVGIEDEEGKSEKFFPASLKDLSGGGALINSNISLPLGTVILFEIPINDQMMVLTAQVVRNKESDEDYSRNLGCEFLGIDEADQKKIIAYCTGVQLKSKRRVKNIV